ncbi:MAG: hypothetical protein SGI88_21610 [Candidatus Hydrogenedentes bacterium]|nr:hypothetical protein [Candidatus Hydrogenedentota bacterium]
MRIEGWKITGAIFVATAAMIVATISWLGFNEAAIRLLVRNTARISVTLFLLAFTASSLQYFFRAQWSRYLLKNRRYIGVSFAMEHTVHFLCLVVLFVWFPDPFRAALLPVTLIGGGLAYVFIALMTLRSFDRTAAMIGPRAWRALHTVGAYYIWVLFAQSYFPRAWKDVWYIPFAAMLVGGLMLRIAAALARRSRAQLTDAVAERA